MRRAFTAPVRISRLLILIPTLGAMIAGPALAQDTSSPAPRALEHLSQAVLGRWEGRVYYKAGGPGGLRNYRVLVIHSIREEQGQWLVQAEYGFPEAPLAPVDLRLELSPRGTLDIRFTAPPNLDVNLSLVREGVLSGTTVIGKGREERPIRLEKVEALR